MKATTAHSIGAALRACAAQASVVQVSPAQRPPRPAQDATVPDRGTVPPLNLTPRQLEVLALLCEGLPNKRICQRLNIASGTVKVHISCILRELGVASRLQAVVAAGRSGLLRDPVLSSSGQAAGAAFVTPPGMAVGSPRIEASSRVPVAF